jgi:hypothetical protein
LTFAMFGPVFAPGIWPEQLAGVEPVHCPDSGQNRRELAAKLEILRTPMVPEGIVVRRLRKAEYFLHASVAVRGHDEHRAGQPTRGLDPHDQIMMKLAALPVLENVVAAEIAPQSVEQRTKPQILGQRFDHRAKPVTRAALGRIPTSPG